MADIFEEDLRLSDKLVEDIVQKLYETEPGTKEYAELLKQYKAVTKMMDVQVRDHQVLEEIRQADEKIVCEKRDIRSRLAGTVAGSFVEGLSAGAKIGFAYAAFRAHLKMEQDGVILAGGLKDFWKLLVKP